MNTLTKHWPGIGLIFALIIFIYLDIFFNSLNLLQSMLMLNFGAFLLHQFEEYDYPGWFPGAFNSLMFKSKSPSNFPLNGKTAFIINVAIFYPIYIIPIVFYHIIWLGLGIAIMGFMQVIVHGIVFNKVFKTKYNPGMFFSLLGLLPLGIWYIYVVSISGLAGIFSWILAIIFVGLASYFGINKPITWFKDEKSPYKFLGRQISHL